MDVNRRQAAILRHQSRQLMAMADELDPPVTPVKASPVARLICPDCGTEYAGPEYRHGDPCLTEYCVGLISRKGALAKPRSCNCYYDQQRCNCRTPDEPLTDRQGRPLGVTLGELAYQQAVRDFVVGGTDDCQSQPAACATNLPRGHIDERGVGEPDDVIVPESEYGENRRRDYEDILDEIDAGLDIASTYGGRS